MILDSNGDVIISQVNSSAEENYECVACCHRLTMEEIEKWLSIREWIKDKNKNDGENMRIEHVSAFSHTWWLSSSPFDEYDSDQLVEHFRETPVMRAFVNMGKWNEPLDEYSYTSVRGNMVEITAYGIIFVACDKYADIRYMSEDFIWEDVESWYKDLKEEKEFSDLTNRLEEAWKMEKDTEIQAQE